MGSPENEPGRSGNEQQHRVTLTKGFFMQTTEVTQGQWRAVMGSNPSFFKNCGDNCPVDNVSWNDVQDFIKRLNAKDDRANYRLPTEAEWEYAARSGSSTPFAFGNCLSASQSNYDGRRPLNGCNKEQYRKKPVKVASFSPNAWGLYDMHGNVWEWCADWYGEYPQSAVVDPLGPEKANRRVLRGGSWDNGGRYVRSAYRYGYKPTRRFRHYGFRVVRGQITSR
jgi:formylglycine-generating enzyme required for sulfatase activity